LTPCEEKPVEVFIPAVISNIFPRFHCTGEKGDQTRQVLSPGERWLRLFSGKKCYLPLSLIITIRNGINKVKSPGC